jgi:hypothetical protein
VPHDLPNLKDLDLFADICTELRAVNQPLKDVAQRLGKAASTVSECIKSLEKHYDRELITKVRNPKPTKEGEKILDMFNKIVALTRGVDGAGDVQQHEIRIISTRSLLNRLFPGPVSAFMMWLKITGSSDSARVIVGACDHNELMSRLTERGVNAYHWGICWKLPQASSHSYLNFTEIPIDDGQPSTDAKTCSTPIVALTSDLDYGLQGDELKALFRSRDSIAAADLWKCLETETVAVVNTEPEDELRIGLMDHINRSRTIAVGQYEDALYHVRSMDANLTLGPGWYQYRNHVDSRPVLLHGTTHRRTVQLVMRKSMTDNQGRETQLKDLSTPVLAFYVILRMFLGERRAEYRFAEHLFANGPESYFDPETGKVVKPAARPVARSKANGTARSGGFRLDPAIHEITPAKIDAWIRENQKTIQRRMESIKGGQAI